MTEPTDALVSELISCADDGRNAHIHNGLARTSESYHFRMMANLRNAADAIERLTRELGETNANEGDWVKGAKCSACKGTGEDDDARRCNSCGGTGGVWMTWKQRAETAEAALSAARAELAECRSKALEEAAELALKQQWVGTALMFTHGRTDLAAAIRALKEAHHE